jgi:peptide deformylase
VLPIVRMGAEILKRPASEFTDFAYPTLPEVIENMVDTMVAVHGIGLAAPQIALSKRIVVFFVPAARNDGFDVPLTVMLNPVITPLGPETKEDWEACLSVPGLTGLVPRWTSIRYSYQDPQGRRHEREAHGFHARVVQHECDHLDGIVYPMRMKDLSSLSYVEQLKSEAAERGEIFEVDDEGETEFEGEIPSEDLPESDRKAS